MKMFTYIVAVGLMSAFATGSALAEEGWITDLAKAKEIAKAEDKSILMNFTGSDW